MKYVKLLAIFLVVVGGLVWAFSKGGRITFGKNEFGGKNWKGYGKWVKRLEDEQKKASEWDEALYIAQFKDIEQKKSGKLITKDSYDLAHLTLRNNAIDRLCNTFPKYLKQENYSDVKVREIRRGLDTVAKYEEFKSFKGQPRLAHIDDVFKHYCEVLDFVNSSHAIGAKFDTKHLTWTSFDDRKQGVVNRANALKTNPLYAEMKTIKMFEDGLKEDVVREAAEKSRATFYNRLSDQIIAYFEYIVPKVDTTDANQLEIFVGGAPVVVFKDKLDNERLTKVGQLWSRFDDENEGPGNTKLNNFKTRFGNALKEKEAVLKRNENPTME